MTAGPQEDVIGNLPGVSWKPRETSCRAKGRCCNVGYELGRCKKIHEEAGGLTFSCKLAVTVCSGLVAIKATWLRYMAFEHEYASRERRRPSTGGGEQIVGGVVVG